ncbi:MAG: hypothetical protein WC346_05950 [Methanogenium sp.]|jgi:hypothetical protein
MAKKINPEKIGKAIADAYWDAVQDESDDLQDIIDQYSDEETGEIPELSSDEVKRINNAFLKHIIAYAKVENVAAIFEM